MPDPVAALETVKVRVTEVPITPENPSGITLDTDPFHVSKEKDTSRLQVEWVCTSSGFTIEFNGDSPFPQSQFTRSTPGSLLSQGVRDGVPPDDQKIYKYSVRIGDRVLDPGGIVTP